MGPTRWAIVGAIAALLVTAGPAYAVDVNAPGPEVTTTQNYPVTFTGVTGACCWCSQVRITQSMENTTGSIVLWSLSNLTHWCWGDGAIQSESGQATVNTLGPGWSVKSGPGWSMQWWQKPTVRHSHSRATFALVIGGQTVEEHVVDVCIYTSYNGNKGSCA